MTTTEKDEYVDITGTLRKAQRQVEGGRTKTGLRLLRALEPEDLNLPERLRFYYLRALAHLQRRDPARAFPDLERAAALVTQLHNPDLGARIANLIGWAHVQQNRPAMAIEFHHRARRAVQAGSVTDPEFAAVVYGNLGSAYCALEDYGRAAEAYRQALPVAEAAESLERLAAIRAGLALALFQAGRLPEARLYALQALETAERSDEPEARPRLRATYATILVKLENSEEAERQWRRVLQEAAEFPALLVQARTALTGLALERGDAAAAESEAQAACATAHEARDPALLARALHLAGGVADAREDAAQAGARWREALHLLAGAPASHLLEQIYLAYARFLGRQGDLPGAIAAYESAYGVAPVHGAHATDLPPPALPGFTRTPATNQERRARRAANPAPVPTGALRRRSRTRAPEVAAPVGG